MIAIVSTAPLRTPAADDLRASAGAQSAPAGLLPPCKSGSHVHRCAFPCNRAVRTDEADRPARCCFPRKRSSPVSLVGRSARDDQQDCNRSKTRAHRRKRADLWRLAWLATPDDVQLGISWVVVAAFRCLGLGRVWGTRRGTQLSARLVLHYAGPQGPVIRSGDTRKIPLLQSREKAPFAGASHAEGGTRTPDTRIMIPRHFGFTEPSTGPGGQTGDTTAVVCAPTTGGISHAASFTPAQPRMVGAAGCGPAVAGSNPVAHPSLGFRVMVHWIPPGRPE